jgi:hypothetical protein
MHEASGKEGAEPDAERCQQLLEESASRSCDAEDGLEDTQCDDEEQGRTKDGMQGDVVDAARPLGGERTPIEALVLNLGHASRTADLARLDVWLHDGQQRAVGGGGLDADESPYCVHAAARSGADHGDRRVQGLGQREGVEITLARSKNISHIDDDQRREMVGDYLTGQGHLTMELGGIEHQEDGLGTRLAFNLAAQGAYRNALVFRGEVTLVSLEAPDSGQVQQPGAGPLDLPLMLLHGDAGVVPHLLAQAREPVEDR